jgi:hypothetical protein
MKTTLAGSADCNFKTTSTAALSADCAEFRASEFTIKGDAARQVDCTQVFHWELFFVDRNHSPTLGGRESATSLRKSLEDKKIAFA